LEGLLGKTEEEEEKEEEEKGEEGKGDWNLDESAGEEKGGGS